MTHPVCDGRGKRFGLLAECLVPDGACYDWRPIRLCGSPMPSVLRFDRFEFQVDSGELITLDSRVRLEPQPAKLLALLACRPGELVSREELQREIWPADTFVDFERGINYCIRSIRRALDDSAAAPRFIETLPRRGYRFLPAVEDLSGSPSVEMEGPAGASGPGSPAPPPRDCCRAALPLPDSA